MSEINFPSFEIEPIATLKRVGRYLGRFVTQHLSEPPEAQRGAETVLCEESQLELDFNG